ncbi:hypothetical protein RUM43_010787 [Polyplax serrata]|uniref:Uncharacterized protein n=1 Tax=Polyplax serrata TaxID=468196 RepID=A0AAN8P0V7_POLSC
MKCSVVVVLLVSIVGLTRSANILVILPTPAFSHQSFYRTYLLGLHSRGHNLTVATPNPIQNPNMTGYREIDLNYAYAHLSEALVAAFGTSKLVRMNPAVYFLLATKVVDILCNKILADDNLMSLYRNNEKFDLLVIEWGINYCFYPFEKLSDGKLIGIASYELGSLTHMSLGNPSNPAYVPDYAMDNTDRMSFPERVRMTLFYWFMSSVVIVLRWHEYFITKKYFGPDAPDIFETNKKVSLVFENSHPSMSYPRPWNVNLIPIGGPAFHLIGRKPGELPKVGHL